MTDITAFQSPPSLFKTHYSAAIRIWHWITFLTFTASIVLVLLGSTVFTMRGNTAMIQEEVQKKGSTVSTDAARAVAHEYSDKLWMLHKYVGYGLCFLLLFRMVLEGVYSKEKRLAGKIKKALLFKSQNENLTKDRSHYLF
ncbi:MAG TPA: cytochrome b/b6 domain-containing protein, partial [Chitinophagaceae bacterium]|nr:cytochrome b/b6 domain-containing protein [Chitinophagaceae bacterium]